MRAIYKRILSFCMALVMLFGIAPMLIPPVQAEAATTSSEDDLQTVVEQQIRAFAKSINKTNADDSAAMALAKHGLTGGGKKLSVGKTHALTATLWNSELFQVATIASCVAAVEHMQTLNMASLPYLHAGYGWRESNSYYNTFVYTAAGGLHENQDLTLIPITKCSQNLNSYDSSLNWMAGDVRVDFCFQQKKITKDEITYDVKCVISDRFDFDISQGSGFDKLISGLGALLFREFDWESKVTFQLEVPNECEHSYTTKTTKPTCTAKGYTTYTCTLCGCSFTGNNTNATGHTYKSKVTAPTCSAQGYTTHTCSCGESYVDSYVDVTEHAYANGICTVCGAEQSMGDLSEDGLITSTDVVLLRRYIAGGYDVTLNPKAGDLNGDGIVTATDVVFLRRYIAGGYGIILPHRAS